MTKIGEDLWLFTARFGKAKLPLPIPVPVKWAGDTPVISVTKLTIPTMGTFTARVRDLRDHYAGTWDAGDHGGHMWGRIERPKAAPAPAGGQAEADERAAERESNPQLADFKSAASAVGLPQRGLTS